MKQVFLPSDLRRFTRQMYMVFTPFFLLFLYQADSWESRAVFAVFAAIFLTIIHTMLARAAKGGRPILLDERGLHHEPLLERYGAQDYPWREITAIDLVRGSKRSEWLSLKLRDGPFRRALQRPVLDRLAGGDVYLPLLHDQPGAVIVEEARKFWRRYGNP
jgi:hypothetical protein